MDLGLKLKASLKVAVAAAAFVMLAADPQARADSTVFAWPGGIAIVGDDQANRFYVSDSIDLSTRDWSGRSVSGSDAAVGGQIGDQAVDLNNALLSVSALDWSDPDGSRVLS